MVVAAALYLRATRGMTFHYDDWSFVLSRQDWTVDAFLEPHNEHLMLATTALYKVMFELAGADYTPYRVAVTLELLALVGVLFVYARRRVGSGWALVASLLVLFCGAGFEDFLWPVNVGFLTSLLALLGALLALDREDRAGDILAGACVLIALSCSSLGIPIAVGVAAEIVARAMDERKGPGPFLSRLSIVVVPLALYGLWRIGYHPPGELRSENAGKVLRYGADTGAAAAGGLLAVGIEWGRLALLGLAGVVVWRLARGRPADAAAGAAGVAAARAVGADGAGAGAAQRAGRQPLRVRRRRADRAAGRRAAARRAAADGAEAAGG